MQNGGKQSDLVEFTKIGLIHSPSGRLLTSETFQGVLNVQGASLKRKQIWTLYTEVSNPNAFLLQNHQGNFLSADGNGKVSLTSEKPDKEERFIIHFDPKASGEIALQSKAHGFFLHWSGTEIRCFSKEPVWWGMRLGMHPQIHLRCVHRNSYIRSANKDTELRAVTKMPYNSKFLLWLQQLPLPSASGQSSCSKEDVARLSRVAIRTQVGRYLHSSGKLVDSIDKATLFAVTFKPGTSQKLMFQDEDGQYLTVGAGGVLQVKMGIREPRREEIFAIDTPSIQVRLWAFNNKFACNKHGLTFSTTIEETEGEKETAYQLEYVGGGRGLNMGAIVGVSATPSAESSPAVFGFDETEEGAPYLTTGLWRLRAQDGRLWQIPASGTADLAPKDCTDPSTTFEILYVSCYQEEGDGSSKGKINPYGGIVIRTLDGRSTAVKPLGAFGAIDRLPDTVGWAPTSPEVLHLLPMINRTSVAIYSPLACAYLAPIISNSSNARRTSFGASSTVDCTSSSPQQWFLKNLLTGTVQFFTKFNNDWMMLSATSQGGLTLVASGNGPEETEGSGEGGPETEFVICMTDDKFALLRSLTNVGGRGKPTYLTSNLQGGIKLDGSGVITPGYIWQL